MERKTALAGGIVEFFSARFTAAAALFNAEVVPSHPSGGWDLASIIKTRGGYGKTVQCGGYEEGLQV